MGLFTCSGCKARDEALVHLRRQNDELIKRVTALADAKVSESLERTEALRARAASHLTARPATDADLSRLPEMLTVDRLSPAMRGIMTMTGHYRAPVAVLEAQAAADVEAAAARASGQKDAPAATVQPI